MSSATTTLPTPSTCPSLSHFKLLSFDVYGTLIDWESGIFTAASQYLLPKLSCKLPPDHEVLTRTGFLHLYHLHETEIEKEHPGLKYSKVLEGVYRSICSQFGIAIAEEEEEKTMVAFGKSVPDWPAFPDTVQALQDLREMGYTLVVLSNVDRESFNGTVKKQFGGLGTSGMGPFGAILTAEEIGSYKPDVRNFLYLKQKAEKKWGWGTGEILHVAQSLFHDHVPAKGLGWWTCWVRRGAAEMGGKGMGEDPLGNGLKWDWKVESLGGLVEVMRKEKREVDLTGEGK